MGSVWRLALSALLAFALLAGPVMADIAMAAQHCDMYSALKSAHHGVTAMDVDNAAPHHPGSHAHHAKSMAKTSHDASEIPKHHNDGATHDAAHGDDCCSTMCQSACLNLATLLVPPLARRQHQLGTSQ
jgi:hypothetical protein